MYNNLIQTKNEKIEKEIFCLEDRELQIKFDEDKT